MRKPCITEAERADAGKLKKTEQETDREQKLITSGGHIAVTKLDEIAKAMF